MALEEKAFKYKIVTMKSCILLLLALLGRTLASSSSHGVSSDTYHHCHIAPSFHSPYVTLLLEERSQITGCISKATTNKSQEVHFLSLGSSSFQVQSASEFLPTVTLHIEPRIQQNTHVGPLIIILHTPFPIMWHLVVERISNTSHLTVVVTHQSQVMPLQLPLKFRLIRKNRPKEKLLSWIKKNYGVVTTVARIQRANEITLYVGIDDEAPDTCDVESMSVPGHVNAFYVQPQPTEGCIGNGTTVEGKPRDVHVIELMSGGSTNSVVVHLQPHGQRQLAIADKPVVQKDLLLVLSCHKQVIWKVWSQGIKGSLHVVAQYPLSPENLPNYQSLDVEAGTLPNTTKALLASVERRFGPVDNFMKAKIANKVKIFVEGRGPEADEQSSTGEIPTHHQLQGQSMQSDGERGMANKMSNTNLATLMSSLSSPPSFNITLPTHFPSLSEHLYSRVNEVVGSNVRNPVLESSDMKVKPWDASGPMDSRRLFREMIVLCNADELLTSVPSDAVMRVLHHLTGSNDSEIYLTFRDRQCQANINGTHYVLQSSLDDCGTTRSTEADGLVYHNQVLFWTKGTETKLHNEVDVSSITETFSDDEDIGFDSGSGSEPLSKMIKIQEVYSSSGNKDQLLLPLSFRCVYDNHANPDKNPQQSGVAHPHVYRMDIYTKNAGQPVPDEAFPLQVHVHDHILVETRIDAGPHLNVITDKCWLSDHPYPGLKSAKKTELIRDSCPADLSVKLINEGGNHQESQRIQRFTFQLSDDFADTTIYLHCQLTACSNSPLPRPDNIKKCVNPEEYCKKQSLRPFLEKSPDKHFSLEIKGPLRVLPKLRWDKPIKTGNFPKTATLPINSPGFGKSHKEPEGTVQHVIVIGLSTETVVGIAFASFVIGAGLMAILWYIHLRTDPLRNDHGRHPHSIAHPSHHHPLHSGYDLSGHSGSSTPSSQAPMTAHTCTSPGQTVT